MCRPYWCCPRASCCRWALRLQGGGDSPPPPAHKDLEDYNTYWILTRYGAPFINLDQLRDLDRLYLRDSDWVKEQAERGWTALPRLARLHFKRHGRYGPFTVCSDGEYSDSNPKSPLYTEVSWDWSASDAAGHHCVRECRTPTLPPKAAFMPY